MTHTVHVGDCIEVMRGMDAGSVQCVVTSPPYFGLRRYLFDKAVVVRYDLSHEKREKIIEELEKRGIEPRC